MKAATKALLLGFGAALALDFSPAWPAGISSIVGFPDIASVNAIGTAAPSYPNIGVASVTSGSSNYAVRYIWQDGGVSQPCSAIDNVYWLRPSSSLTGCYKAVGFGLPSAVDPATIPSLVAPNTWSALQSFNSGMLALKGATSGTLIINAAAVAGGNTITLPAGTTDFSATGGTHYVVQQSSAGAALTVGQLASSALSDAANLAYLNASNVFTGTTQKVTAATTTGPDWEVAITGDTYSRIALGMNSTDVARLSFGPGNAVRDLFLERAGAAALRFGAPDAASPVAQTLYLQSVVGGTSNTAGANGSFYLSRGTGTGVAGNYTIYGAPHSTTGTTQNSYAAVLTLNGDTGALQLNKYGTAGALVNDTSGNLTSLAYTDANTASTLVKRDGSGNFSAGTISAALTGHASSDLALTGGTLTGNLLFTDNSYDIGASGATRPRTGYFGTSVVSPLVTLGAQQTVQGSLVLANTAAGAYSTTVKSSNSASAAWTLTLPTTAGTNTYVLTTDGNGVTSWAAQSSGGCTNNCTFTGTTTVSAGSFVLSGNISAAAWTTNGIRYANATATLTDTSSSGTVAKAYTNLWPGSTIAASNTTVFTNYIGSYFSLPVASTNVTFTSTYALGADSLYIYKASTGHAIYMEGSSKDTSFYLGSGSYTSPTDVPGIRANAGGFTINAKAGGVIYLGRDNNANTDIQYNSGNGDGILVNGTTGALRFGAYGAGTLTTDASGNVTATSDVTMKNVDGPFTRGLADLAGIEPILYHWNKASGLDQKNQYAGFSAQNVRDHIPEAVGVSENGTLSFQDRPVLAALVNAVNELKAEVDALKATAPPEAESGAVSP